LAILEDYFKLCEMLGYLALKVSTVGWILAKFLFSINGHSEKVSRILELYVSEVILSQVLLITEICAANELLFLKPWFVI
jgi:hypothetical protein